MTINHDFMLSNRIALKSEELNCMNKIRNFKVIVQALMIIIVLSGCLDFDYYKAKIRPVEENGWVKRGEKKFIYDCSSLKVKVTVSEDISSGISCLSCIPIMPISHRSHDACKIDVSIYSADIKKNVKELDLKISDISMSFEKNSEKIKPDLDYNDFDEKMREKSIYYKFYEYRFIITYDMYKKNKDDNIILNFNGLGKTCKIPPLIFKGRQDIDFGVTVPH